MATNNCEGCRDDRKGNCLFFTPTYKDNIDTSKCPCNICIVKVMCTKVCEERVEFYLHNTIVPNQRKE